MIRIRHMFDKINRYRWAGLILLMPGLYNLIFHPEMQITVTRIIYWIGLLVLLTALAFDSIEVYRGKRQVRQMIESYLTRER